MPKIIKDLDQKILKAASELFRSQGYDQADIRQIAAKANIAVGTLYNYYRNKEELFAAVVHNYLQDGWSEIDTHVIGDDPERLLYELLVAIQNQMNGNEHAVWQHIMQRAQPRNGVQPALMEIKKSVMDVMSVMVNRIEKNIQEIRRKYSSEPLPQPIAYRLAMTIILAMFPLTHLLPIAESSLTVDYFMTLVKSVCLQEVFNR